MSNTPPDFNQAWQGLEPEQPRPRRGLFFVALAAAVFLLLGACLLSYFVFQQRTQAPSGLGLSTATGTIVTIVGGDETVDPTAGSGAAETPSGFAATATQPGSANTPPPFEPPNTIASRIEGQWVIDGRPDRVGLPVYTSPYVVFTHRDWDGTDDLEASWEVGWNDTYLYLLATVIDDRHVQTQTARTAFRGDSLELQIDTGRSTNFSSSLGPDDFQISLSPGDFGNIPPSAWRFQGTTAGEMLDAAGPHSILVAAQPTGNGFVLEAAIPWRDLNLTPVPGIVLGLAVNFNDNDTPGTAVQEMMKSSAPNRRFGDPTTWGVLQLE